MEALSEVSPSAGGGASLALQKPPTILQRPGDAAALVGGRVLLKAAYMGHPEPTVKWTRAGKELRNDERTSITSTDGVSCLLLQDITTDDSGKYDICVENALGSDCTFTSVSVEGPPDPPSGKPSVSADSNSANVAWSSSPYDGGKIVIGYAVEYSLVGSDIWTTAIDYCYSLSYDVGGLVPGGRYVFRIYAINAHGRSKPSRESEIVLLEEEPKAPPVTFEPRIVGLEPDSVFRNRFDVAEELGKGRFGVVYKVFDKISSQKLAAKFIKCRTSKDRDKVKDEIEIMNLLRHPKLLQLAAAYESSKDIIMVTEYISGGELFERVVADDFTLTEKDCILFMRQICEGAAYMHTQNIVHLDLKPENIMCHTRTSHEIKIIDFGLAQKLNPDAPVRVLFGTPEFIPPEIINYEPIGTESDIWSLGVICYVLLSGLSPFMGDNDAETFSNITRAEYDFEDEAFNAVSQNARNFISALLLKKREDRLSAEQCLRHIWLDPDSHKETVILSTDKLKKFIIRRKWQKTGNAIRALGRMATLSASRRNSANSTPNTPRPSISGTNTLEMLNEEETIKNCSNNNEDIKNLIGEVHEVEHIKLDEGTELIEALEIEPRENGLLKENGENKSKSEDIHPKKDELKALNNTAPPCKASTVVDSKITNNSVKLGDAITKLNRAVIKCTSPSSTCSLSLQRLPIYSSRSVAKTIKKFNNNEPPTITRIKATTERGRNPATNGNKCDKLSVSNGENNCNKAPSGVKSSVDNKLVTKTANKLVPNNNNSIKPPSTVRYRSPSPSLLRKTQAVIAKEQCNKHINPDKLTKHSPTSNKKASQRSNNKAPVVNKKEKFQSTVAFWNSQKT